MIICSAPMGRSTSWPAARSTLTSPRRWAPARRAAGPTSAAGPPPGATPAGRATSTSPVRTEEHAMRPTALCVIALLAAAPLRAGPNEEAREHFHKGQTHYALGEFAEAAT